MLNCYVRERKWKKSNVFEGRSNSTSYINDKVQKICDR